MRITLAISEPTAAFCVPLPRGYSLQPQMRDGHMYKSRCPGWNWWGGNGKIQIPLGKSGLLAWGVLCRAVKIVFKLYGP